MYPEPATFSSPFFRGETFDFLGGWGTEFEARNLPSSEYKVVLFLDEPTIGLDVIAQHNIQTFLRYYQQLKKITILLTSHYMKDIVALCNRVVIVAQGVIVHDGSLAEIVERFSRHKVITLQFTDHSLPSDLGRYGEIIEVIDAAKGAGVTKVGIVTEAMRRAGGADAL